MIKEWFIHSCVFFSLTNIGISQKYLFQDSFLLNASTIYIDKLNQIYALDKSNAHLLKLNEDWSTNQELSSPFLNEYVTLDVSDPMKIILFFPSYSSVQILDESLGTLSDEYYSNFNTESAICFFSTTQYCFFAEGKIHLKNILDQRIVNSESIYYERDNEITSTVLKSNGKEIFLLLPGIGRWQFSGFLNEEFSVEDSQIKSIDLKDNQLFYLKENQIYQWEKGSKPSEPIYKSNFKINSFAVNSKYLIIAENNQIRRFRWLN
ncbi:MAG: hypothetical protein IPG87_03845 [Saprospiraceae bacterium]|nr:hypothetical protein [Candidatus Vicinibacter affinis]